MTSFQRETTNCSRRTSCVNGKLIEACFWKVSWIRKSDDDLQLLTIGEMSHTPEPRIETEFVYPHFWPLKFKPALTNDTGLYLCHVATDPPLIHFIFFQVSGMI